MPDVSQSEPISTRQRRIAELARHLRGKPLHALSRHIDESWMREAYRRTRKDGAVGVDGETGAKFAVDLEANLRGLRDRALSGRYRAPPVRRVLIPKGDGKKTRPIGITTFEDKVLQRAVVMALEPVYEEEFTDFSYGFRRGRSAHDALRDLQHQLWKMGGGVVLELDIQSFFDQMNRGLLQQILRQRVTDGVLLRLIGKWLHAGVMEDGRLSQPESGTPQGGVISPLLANIYLHEVFDGWWIREVLPRLGGEAHAFRYADDIVIVFANERDARRVMEVLPKRFGRFGLTLHPEKTRLAPFQRPRTPLGAKMTVKPGSFDFLGLTQYWTRSRKGQWMPKQKTARSRLGRALKSIALWCRKAHHRPVVEQAKTLGKKLRGHYAYFGVTGNYRALGQFFQEVKRIWRGWLCRRSQRGRLSWEGFHVLLKRNPLPPPIAVHSLLRRSANP
ncbi:MAG: group II intron reverse transcriptase/maturase [Deltaproteobacteria bacterium]|nr:group II intron reverse transcriptase/maturase [Deltaproteobacteria bacterium]